MRRRWWWLSLWLLGCATADQNRGPVVKELRIEGARQISPSELRGHLQTRKDSWLPFTQPSHFDPDVWRTDLRRLERFYREKGYYQAKVVSSDVRADGEDGVRLEVTVDEGAPTAVRDISIEGLSALSEEQRQRLLEKLPLHPGELFVEEKWEAFLASLRFGLRDEGYAEAKVDGQAEVDLEQRVARLRIHADPGIRYKFGNVFVAQSSKSHIEPWRVEERVEKALKESRYYSESAKQEAQRQVVRMGVFGAVELRNGPADEKDARVPIVVDAREAPIHSIRAGGGLGVDQGLAEVRVLGQYSHRNFFGGLRRLTVTGGVGYAIIYPFSAISRQGPSPRSGPVALLSTELRQPRVLTPDLEALAKVELERTIAPAYAYFGARTRVGLVWQVTRHLLISPTYGLEAYHQDAGGSVLGTTAPTLLFGCKTNCVLSYLEQSLEYDRRDNKLSPKAGFYFSVSFQEGGGFLGGSFSYFRYVPEVRFYMTPESFSQLTLAVRFRVGSLNPISGNPSDSPSVARFYSGGANQMRGFGTRRLSPMVVVPLDKPSRGFTGEAVPVGGNALAEGSLELRYQTFGNWAFATFLDTGAVTSGPIDFKNLDDTLGATQLAVGAGVRYRTPAGPLRLDLAYRPNIGRPLELTQSGDGNLTFPSPTGCFGIGSRQGTRAGSPEGPCAIHLSIGEAF